MNHNQREGSFIGSVTNTFRLLYSNFWNSNRHFEPENSESDVDTARTEATGREGGIGGHREFGTGNAIGVVNQATATFNYRDNAAIYVQAPVESKDAVTAPDCGSQNTSNQTPSPGQPLPSAVGIINQGNMTINNPVLNAKTSQVETEEKQITRILKTINDNSWDKSHFSIRDNFKADKFAEPDFEVHPQMVESPYFYQGGHPMGDYDDEEDDEDPESEAMLTPIKHPEYYIDNKFLYYEDADDAPPQFLSAESMLDKIHERKEKFDILGIVAQAGAGKTTCLRRWARKTMEKSGMSRDNGFQPFKESRFEMVHFIEMKTIGYSANTTLQEILFKEFFRDADDAKKAYDWLHENQDKTVIFLDGLDQARWKISEEDVHHIGRFESTTTGAIFANLLTRNLLPGVRIVLSSREHTATSLPEETWLGDVVTLTGFAEEDAKKLFNAITIPTAPAERKIPTNRAYQDNAFAKSVTFSNWDILVCTSTALLPFVSVPAFLMFTAIVFNTYRTAPTSITDLMAKVVGTLQYSLVIKEKKHIWEVIGKLKLLSHTGMTTGLVIFSENDLRKFELEANDIRDLLLMVPRGRSLSHNLVEGDNVFFFCHQIIQEFLSACFIVEMKLSDFKKFVQVQLNKDRWSVVRRFVCGLIFTISRRYNQLLKISDRDEKQRILRESLASQLKVEENWKWFELYAAIYESKDDELINSIKRIDMYLPTVNAIHLVSALMVKSKQYDCINCNEFTDEMLNIIVRNLGNIKVKTDLLELTASSKFTSTTLNKFLRSVNSDDIQIRHGYTIIDRDGLDLNNICRLKIEIYWSDMGIILQRQESDDVQLIFYDDNKSNSPVQFGNFHTKEKLLKIDRSLSSGSFFVYCTEIASYYLKPDSVIFNTSENSAIQFLFHSHIDSMLSWQNNMKIDEVVLVYVYHKYDEDSDEYDISHKLRHCQDKLSSLIAKYQVQALDLAIVPGNIGLVSVSSLDALRRQGCNTRINVVEVVGCDADLQHLSNKLNGQKFDVLRIITWYKVSEDALVHFIKNLNSTKQLWIYCPSSEEEEEKMYSQHEEQKLHEVAISSEIILKIDGGNERNDPWNAVLALI